MPMPSTETPRVPAQQMALRVAMISTLTFVAFGIVFFRLWYLQVLDGGKYLAEARSNRARTESIQAPRGVIRDREGRPIVENRRATVVALDPREIPRDFRSQAAEWGQAYGQWTSRATRAVGKVSARRGGLEGWRRRASSKIGAPPRMPRATGGQWDLYRRLGRVLQRSPQRINNTVVASLVQVPYANVTVKEDVDRAQRQYIGERHEHFPGVSIEQIYVRSYPAGRAGAQMLGEVREVDPEQLKTDAYKNVSKGTIVGRSGLESEYDQFLRGVNGKYRIEVNALGERRSAATVEEPRSGRDLKLWIDLPLQEAGQRALAQAGGGKPSAFVAMNPKTGAVYALGSLPDYSPRELMGPFETRGEYEAKFGAAAGKPLVNRATQGMYPVGSTFKVVTALAALDKGFVTPATVFNDTGCVKTGSRDADKACNAGNKVNGPVNLAKAIEVSSDTYFYDIAKRMFGRGDWSLQTWARRLGFARYPGIDLPESAEGAIPSPAHSKEITELELACRKKRKVPSCGIGSGDPTYQGGEQVNFSVGQGGLQATPLQLAVAYSTIINGGAVPTPHIGRQIEDERGVVQEITPGAQRRVHIAPAARSAVMEGLRLAANGSGGTSTGVWAGGERSWPNQRFPIFGKTGTAETPKGDQSWYVAYSYRGRPDRDPIVIVATVERGGFGAAAAAPAVRMIMSKFFGVKQEFVVGQSTDR